MMGIAKVELGKLETDTQEIDDGIQNLEKAS